MDIYKLIDRESNLFVNDLKKFGQIIDKRVTRGSFLVLGGAGSIGQAVCKEIFKRNPRRLFVVDISENNLVELVRDIRSSLGYIDGEFETFAIDVGSFEFEAFSDFYQDFDYVLNLTALKHVRSEKDRFTLMRMVEVNILNSIKIVEWSAKIGVKKYFAVSTDKAANPVNMMGASKRIMEYFLFRNNQGLQISSARFANVAFSDGSLLHSFRQRLLKNQPIVAPSDIRRYFVTPEESGLICLFSCIFGEENEIYIPALSEKNLITFTGIAKQFLKLNGYEPYYVQNEAEARDKIGQLLKSGKWPCLFTPSDTTGEKPFEEFYTDGEEVDFSKFENLGVIKSNLAIEKNKLKEFESNIETCKKRGTWTKKELIDIFNKIVPEFIHVEKGNSLENKM